MSKAETTPIPAVPMTPMRSLIIGIGPAVQQAFYETFGQPIAVFAGPSPDGVVYRFEMDKPGLLPTKIEREWFDGYISGWRASASLAFTLYEPEGNVN
jgi:hypothetical protein